jgi:hypothetical protein
VIRIAKTKSFVNMLPGPAVSGSPKILFERSGIDRKSLYKNTIVKKFKMKMTINSMNCVELL